MNIATTSITTAAALMVLGWSAQLSAADTTAYHELRSKLATINNLTADFEQQVFDERGELQETLSGELTLQRPHFLRWETSYPDHSIMVADGEAVWYYNAFVEQLSIFDQAQNLEQNPMLVLLSDDEDAWQQFDVSYDDNFWHVRERDATYAQVSLAVAFDEDDTLQTLHIDDGQGQVSVFELSSVTLNTLIDDTVFSVEVDDHIEIDDQRTR